MKFTPKTKKTPSPYAGGKKAFAKKAVRKAKTQRLTQFVKKVISSTEEKKIQTISGNIFLSAYTNPGNLPNTIIPIVPYAVTGMTIAQGTGQADRVGNVIRTVSCHIKGVILPNAQGANNPNPTPQEVRVWFFYRKDSNIQPTTLGQFLQAGNSSGAPAGTLLDLTRYVNNDVYAYKGHRSFKVGFANNAGTGNQPGLQSLANNDFKLNCKFDFDVTSMIPKRIKYNDTDNTPFSRNVFMYWETVDADGGSQAATDVPLQMYYTTTFTYTDA